ncbi:Holliday junction resolvase RuvX [candidate division KSB1 bacterium]|nr:Holliday junction resolvase RuvX [candidate division KSB1 bacterium]
MKRIQAGRILGIDYGRKRIGLAISDPSQTLAARLKTILNDIRERVIDEIKTIAAEKAITAIVIGQPLHMSGETGEMAKDIEEFIQQVEQKIDVPIYMWDERLTTVSAEKLLIETGRSPSKSRREIDQLAAAFLLQNFLDRLANVKKENGQVSP